MALPKFTDADDAAERLKSLGDDFALVQNPSYVHPPFEFYPLAPKQTGPLPYLSAAVMDMDGTTTTTETLCLHSLETMVRRITGRLSKDDWPGLDPLRDYPNVIGNSTTRHVEYLVRTYEDRVRKDAFARSFLEAAVWTLSRGKDPKRREEVRSDMRNLGLGDLLRRIEPASSPSPLDINRIARDHLDHLRIGDFTSRVRAAIDVYYYRYHEILSGIAEGRAEELSQSLVGGRKLIEPMPGIGVFLALAKGWLGESAAELYPLLREEVTADAGLPDEAEGRRRLAALGRRFAENPLRLAVVTSSIKYEAGIVLAEVFSVLRDQVARWPVKSDLAGRFSSPNELYDAVITASDSSEIRLKPHRDLYSIALHSIGVMPERFDTVAGFEDSESGTIAIRAAGIGLCVAVPFSDTAGHDFGAASLVLPGGMPQAILQHNLFIEP